MNHWNTCIKSSWISFCCWLVSTLQCCCSASLMHEASSGSWRVMCWSEYTGTFVGASYKGQVLVAFWEACISSSISLQKSGQFCHQVCAHATLVPLCPMFSLDVSSLSLKQCLKLLWTAFKPQRRIDFGGWCDVQFCWFPSFPVDESTDFSVLIVLIISKQLEWACAMAGHQGRGAWGWNLPRLCSKWGKNPITQSILSLDAL